MGPRQTLLVVLGISIACLPWGFRNHRTFDGAIFFVRSNFGLELRMGNHEGAHASMDVMDRIAEHRFDMLLVTPNSSTRVT